MKIAFILLADKPELRKHFTINDIAMVPKEIRDKHGSECKFFTNPPHLSPADFCLKVMDENPATSIVALAEHGGFNVGWTGLPLSVLQTDQRGMGVELSRVLTFWIKRLSALENILKPLGNRKSLLLPFRNFKDATAQELWSLISSNLSERTYPLGPEIEKLMAYLRTREFPKRRGDYRDKYFVDERNYHFQYGHELHSKPVYKGGKHNAQCAISANVRLGIPYNNERHFNLSLEDNSSLKGRNFVNCHDENHEAGSCDHLNIFPNDFIN